MATAAERAELSVSFLSAVERGQANPSVGTLVKLADAYGTTVPALGADRPGADRPLLRPPDRPRVLAAGGSVLIEDLIARPVALEAQRIEVQAGGGSDDAYAHPGEEFVYVLAGDVSFWLDVGERHDLTPGDALHFRGTRPHRWRNDGSAPASLLWINVPVVDPAPTAGDGRGTARPRPARRRFPIVRSPTPNHGPNGPPFGPAPRWLPPPRRGLGGGDEADPGGSVEPCSARSGPPGAARGGDGRRRHRRPRDRMPDDGLDHAGVPHRRPTARPSREPARAAPDRVGQRSECPGARDAFRQGPSRGGAVLLSWWRSPRRMFREPMAPPDGVRRPARDRPARRGHDRATLRERL